MKRIFLIFLLCLIGVNLFAKVNVTSVKLDESSISIDVNETKTLEATVLPKNATNKAVTWKSSNTSVATVSTTGVVTGKKKGSCYVTVTTKDQNKTAKCQVTVTTPNIPVSKIELNKTTLSLKEGKTFKLIATVTPENATNKKVTWKSSNTNIATVGDTGIVTAIKVGTCEISATAKDGSGKSAKCKLTVTTPNIPVSKIELNKTTLTLKEGKTFKIIATVTPENATNKKVTWSSSNTNIATVGDTGIVTAIKVGSCEISATAQDGSGKSAKCKLTVKEGIVIPVTSVSVSPSSLSLIKGNTTTLTATVLPSNATNKTVTWSSSNTSVATVTISGKVTAKGVGKAVISVVTKDGSKKDTCSVTVVGVGKINVKVLRGNKPVTGLNVVVKNSSNRYSGDTNLNGVATFSNVVAGSYSIYINGDKEGSVKVEDDKTATATITLEEKTITFMFYANSYNLDNGLFANLKQMYKYGSTDKVNIIVFYKSSISDGVYKGKILKSDGNDLTYGLAKISNKNFGDPDTLEDFCKWAMTTYPADEYILNLWNHGSGWTPYWDTRAINHEQDYEGDCLEIWELHEAVEDLDIDAICMDACIMQMMEVLTVLKDDFDICMASENVIPGTGYNYTNLFKGLNDCSTIINAFKYFADLQMEDSYWCTYDTDIQITDLSKIEDVNKSILNISNYLIKGSYGDEIASARLNVSILQHFSKDLGTFLYYLKKEINKSDFNSLVTAYKTSVNNALIYYGERDEITGFAVNLPNKIQYGKYFGDYSKTEFAEVTKWDKVLELQ